MGSKIRDSKGLLDKILAPSPVDLTDSDGNSYKGSYAHVIESALVMMERMVSAVEKAGHS